ncbi:hypothetical protein Tco_1106792 [Tanacetum coccineum]
MSKLFYTRFTKLIINHFLSTNKSIPNISSSKLHSSQDDQPITKLSNTVKGDYKFGMEIPDTMISDAIKKLIGYKFYMAKKVEMNVPNKLKKDVVPRETRSLTIVEETVVGELANSISIQEPPTQQCQRIQLTIDNQLDDTVVDTYAKWVQKLKGPADDDLAVQSFSYKPKESANETNDDDEFDMDLSDDNLNGDDDVVGTVKRLTKPLDKPEREFRRLRKAAMCSHQNESLAIAGRNLFDDEASFSNNTRTKLPTPPKTLHEHSCPNSSGSHEADEYEQNNPSEQVCLSRGDIYNDPSLLRFYQNDDTLPWGNNKRKEKGEDGPEWIVRTINKSETPKPEAPTFAITTRSGIIIQDPPFLALPRPTTDNLTEGETEKEGLEGTEPSITQEPVPRPSILYQPSKTSNLPFLSRLKKQKQDDEDEWLLLIFKQIHFNLPFLEAMIHMPKGAKVLKESGLLS